LTSHTLFWFSFIFSRLIYHDYKFGAGRDIIKNYFKGKILIVDGEEFEERVRVED